MQLTIEHKANRYHVKYSEEAVFHPRLGYGMTQASAGNFERFTKFMIESLKDDYRSTIESTGLSVLYRGSISKGDQQAINQSLRDYLENEVPGIELKVMAPTTWSSRIKGSLLFFQRKERQYNK